MTITKSDREFINILMTWDYSFVTQCFTSNIQHLIQLLLLFCNNIFFWYNLKLYLVLSWMIRTIVLHIIIFASQTSNCLYESYCSKRQHLWTSKTTYWSSIIWRPLECLIGKHYRFFVFPLNIIATEILVLQLKDYLSTIITSFDFLLMND